MEPPPHSTPLWLKLGVPVFLWKQWNWSLFSLHTRSAMQEQVGHLEFLAHFAKKTLI